nr:hypothetical protein [Crateriforma conspicua]
MLLTITGFSIGLRRKIIWNRFCKDTIAFTKLVDKPRQLSHFEGADRKPRATFHRIGMRHIDVCVVVAKLEKPATVVTQKLNQRFQTFVDLILDLINGQIEVLSFARAPSGLILW